MQETKSKRSGRNKVLAKDSSLLMPILTIAELKFNYEYTETMKMVSNNKYGSKIFLTHNLHNTNLKVVIKVM